eukprot:scaffold267066_cov19-Prasinocladus_malaysianus.AAC.1
MSLKTSSDVLAKQSVHCNDAYLYPKRSVLQGFALQHNAWTAVQIMLDDFIEQASNTFGEL